MNDDFLHRPRKAPPPEFLDGLKARLDRQSPLARTRARRFPFSRGLIVGVLLGSAAFAITSLSVNRAPTSLAAFFKAPAQLLARLGGGSSPSEDSQHHRPAPLGPVWLPKHAAPASQGESNDNPPASGTAVIVNSPPSATATAGAPATDTRLPATQSASPASRYVGFTVAVPPGTYPHAQAVVERLSKSYAVKLSLDLGGTAVSSLCSTDYKGGNTNLVELSRRVTPTELRNCDVVIKELKVGHQAIVLARSGLYGPMQLSARDLFLALARQVPVPTDPTVLMDNPYTTWNEINGTLPYDRIHILGPGLGLVQEKLAAALLLEAGCNTYPWIADLRVTDPARYDEICTSVRSDDAYEGSAESTVAYTEHLVREPTVLGILTLSDFEWSKDKLDASVIDGAAPSPYTIADATYPAARTLYLYTNQNYYTANSVFGVLLNLYLTPFSQYDSAPGTWGFVPLDTVEHADTDEALKRLRPPPRF
jgi:phosphate transport system substrate-binding protein